MLRLDPGEGRIRTARQFQVWEGGGEYNVARGLRRCFGLRTAIVTALADNDVGRLSRTSCSRAASTPALIRWAPFDGIGRDSRNGLNFTERGFGVRGAVGVSDRGHTAARQLRPGDVDWDAPLRRPGRALAAHRRHLRRRCRTRRPTSSIEALQAARRHGTVVSLRPQLPAEPVEGHRREGTGAARSIGASRRSST